MHPHSRASAHENRLNRADAHQGHNVCASIRYTFRCDVNNNPFGLSVVLPPAMVVSVVIRCDILMDQKIMCIHLLCENTHTHADIKLYAINYKHDNHARHERRNIDRAMRHIILTICLRNSLNIAGLWASLDVHSSRVASKFRAYCILHKNGICVCVYVCSRIYNLSRMLIAIVCANDDQELFSIIFVRGFVSMIHVC